MPSKNRVVRFMLKSRFCVMAVFKKNICTLKSSDTHVSSSNKRDRHGITEILLKVAFNITTVTLTKNELVISRSHIK